MKLTFSTKAWEQYFFWQTTEKIILTRINFLIKDIHRSPNENIRKPESLKHGLSGHWSRRINDEHELFIRNKMVQY
jgi:toxin YoeB